MGQIRGKNAHIDACNLRSLSSFGTPAAGQHILVSTDNSATADGQGNFDCYVVGDGTTPAAALKIRKKDAELTRILALANCAKVYNVTINNNTGNFSAYNGGISVIYPLEGSGEVKYTVISGVTHNVKLLSDDTVVVGQSAHIVANVASAGTTYDTTSRFLYVQLLQGTDRTPAAIYVNGYDIIKDIRGNVDDLIKRVSTLENTGIADGSITENKLADNSVSTSKINDDAVTFSKRTKAGNFALLLPSGNEPPLQFNTTAKTLTIKANTRLLCGTKFYNLNPWGSDLVLDISSYRFGLLAFDASKTYVDTTSLSLLSHGTTSDLNPIASNQNLVAVCSWTQFGLAVNAAQSYTINGNLYGLSLEPKIASIGIVGNPTVQGNFLAFTLTSSEKSCTVSRSSRIFSQNKGVIPTGSTTGDVVIDLSTDYEGNTLTYGGVLCYNNSSTSPSWRVYPHNVTELNEDDIIIAYYSIFSPSVSCPSKFSLNGKTLGIGIGEDVSMEVISPTFETIALPPSGTIAWWSDFFPITINGVDEMWFFRESGDEDHVSDSGRLYRIRMSDWTKIGDSIKHNFGHCNTCHYDAANDVLLIANLPGSTQYPSALYLFYNVSSWASESNLDFNSVAKTVVDISSLGLGGSTSAFFAENGFGRRNQVFVMTSIPQQPKLCKLVLGMGTNQLTYGTYNSSAADNQYNGTFDIVIPLIDYKNPSGNDGNRNVIQGGDYARGRIITTNGHDQLLGYIWNVVNSNEGNAVARTMIESIPRKADGTIDYCVAEGLCVKDGYVYQGCIKITNDFRETYSIEGFYLAKYPLPY